MQSIYRIDSIDNQILIHPKKYFSNDELTINYCGMVTSTVSTSLREVILNCIPSNYPKGIGSILRRNFLIQSLIRQFNSLDTQNLLNHLAHQSGQIWAMDYDDFGLKLTRLRRPKYLALNVAIYNFQARLNFLSTHFKFFNRHVAIISSSAFPGCGNCSQNLFCAKKRINLSISFEA